MRVKLNGESGNGAVIHTHQLTKSFGTRLAVDSLDLQVPRGSIFGFIGPSGCGKTTTVRMLTGIYKPTSGDLNVLGKNPAHFSRTDRARIGYLIQQNVLYPDLTVWENLNFAASIYGIGLFRGRRLERILDFVELSEDKGKRTRLLSGGMARRLGLAAALVHSPELLFLDEPTAGVDPLLRRKFWDYFERIREEGRTLFVTTQYVGEAAFCDFVGVMDEGRLLTVDSPDGLRKAAYGGEIISVRTDHPISFEQRKKIEDMEFTRGPINVVSDQEIEIVVDEARTAMPLLIEYLKSENHNVSMVEEKLPVFDDVFVRIIEKERADV